MLAVDVETRPTVKTGVPRKLFESRADRSSSHLHFHASQGRFLMVLRGRQVDASRLHVILNFVEELKSR